MLVDQNGYSYTQAYLFDLYRVKVSDGKSHVLEKIQYIIVCVYMGVLMDWLLIGKFMKYLHDTFYILHWLVSNGIVWKGAVVIGN